MANLGKQSKALYCTCANVNTCKEVLKASKAKEPLCIWGCTEYKAK